MESCERERDALVRAHQTYLRANFLIDSRLLSEVCDSDPSNVWFNLNGHNYQGLKHWIELWDYYRAHIKIVKGWELSNVDTAIHGDVGWVTCTRSGYIRWQDKEIPPLRMEGMRSRSTMIFIRRSGEWRAVHAHYSPESEIARPGGI